MNLDCDALIVTHIGRGHLIQCLQENFSDFLEENSAQILSVERK